MAIFKKKVATAAKAKEVKKPVVAKAKTVATKETKAKKEVEVAVAASTTPSTKMRGLDLNMVLIRPHVTEKASDLSEKGVYAFEVNKLANKMHVRMAIEKLYAVKPVKVAVVNIPAKMMKSRTTNRKEVKHAGKKKALVYLKSGDKIEFV